MSEKLTTVQALGKAMSFSNDMFSELVIKRLKAKGFSLIPTDTRLAARAATIAKLREALEPFGKIPIGVVEENGLIFDRCADDVTVYKTHGWPRDPSAQVTVGDFRRARAALIAMTQSQ